MNTEKSQNLLFSLLPSSLKNRFLIWNVSFYCESFKCCLNVTRSKTSPLKVLLKIMTENGVYSTPMKVISETILFVYSLRSALIEIARECHTRWRNYFDGATPLLERSGYIAAFFYPDYSKLTSHWHTSDQPTAWPVPNKKGLNLVPRALFPGSGGCSIE